MRDFEKLFFWKIMLIYIYQSHILLRKVWSHAMADLIPYFLLTDKTSKGKTIHWVTFGYTTSKSRKKAGGITWFCNIYVTKSHKSCCVFLLWSFQINPPGKIFLDEKKFCGKINNIVLFLFHIHYKKNEWLDKKNYEWLIRVNKQPFWKAKWAYKLHIFSRVKRVKKYATSKAIWPWKKAIYSQGSTVHSFECTKSFMNFRINVEHVCLLFVRL